MEICFHVGHLLCCILLCDMPWQAEAYNRKKSVCGYITFLDKKIEIWQVS